MSFFEGGVQKTCSLCLAEKTLKKSHAIANSIFKKIFRADGGKAIVLTLNEQDISYSSDSWWQYQLCGDCERLLNDKYEQYSLLVLRGHAGRVKKLKKGVSFNGIDQRKLNMFFLSILWRASTSRHEAYSSVFLGRDMDEYLRNCLFNNIKIPIGSISVRLSRLCDKSEVHAFSLDSLKGLIVSPFFNGCDYCYAFEGFLVRISPPGIKLSKRSGVGVIHSNKKIMLVPFECIFDVPELHELLMINYGKHIEGKSRVSED